MQKFLSMVLISAGLATVACGGSGGTPAAPSSGGSGGSAILGSEGKSTGAESEFRGVVEAVPPATAASMFKASGRTVATSASTTFVNGTLAGLTVGTHVEVKGTLAGDTVNASRVEIEDAPVAGPTPAPAPGGEPNEAEFSGTISGLSGSAASFQFTAAGRIVKGDATTAVTGRSNLAASFADLKNGGAVEVHGVQRTGFVQATRIHIEDAAADAGEDRDEAELKGTLGAVTGTCPAIASSIGGIRFVTSAATRFDDAACGAFKSGDRVEVKGTRQGDGSIAAARVEKK